MNTNITIVMTFHQEGFNAMPALASMQALLDKTKEKNITIQSLAVLDDADEVTRECIKNHGLFFDCVKEVSYSDLNMSRNMAVQIANGEFIAFFDGGDLWGVDWLHLAYTAATTRHTDEDVIWHPESLFYFDETDFNKNGLFKDMPHPHALAYHFFQSSTNDPEFDRRFLLFHHIWSSNFFAKRSLYIRFPYRPTDKQQGYRMADWLWHVQTTWEGIPHLIVHDTVHMIRMKNSRWPWHARHLSKRLLTQIPQEALKDCNQTTFNYTEQSSFDFLTFVSNKFNADLYLKMYPDLQKNNIKPLDHWLKYGLFKGLDNYSNILISFQETSIKNLRGDAWQCFDWCNYTIAVKIMPSLKESLLNQIIEQAFHDPTIIASGYHSIKNLKRIDSNDFFIRNHINMHYIESYIKNPIKWIVMERYVKIGGGEKEMADIVALLDQQQEGPVGVLITDGTTKETEKINWNNFSIIAPLKKSILLFLPDICGRNTDYNTKVAHILNILRPKNILIYTYVGFQVVEKFGHILSKFSNIYCFYFTVTPTHISTDIVDIYARKTLPYSSVITNSAISEKKLIRLFGNKKIHNLSKKLSFPENEIFAKRLDERFIHAQNKDKQGKWLWVGRLQVFHKGLFILSELAKLRPTYTFDIFGPAGGPGFATVSDAFLQENGLHLPNITYNGIIDNVASANFSTYDGFLFTSLFESMPDIVLEMSAHAIPMVLADVGGLRDTFDENAALFVQQQYPPNTPFIDFANALDRLLQLDADDIMSMVKNAALQVQKKHSQDAYVKNFCNIFNIEEKQIS